MTFYEAAIEVLRKSGRPLHFKKITEVAVRDQLLSHVGRDPAATMGLRLDDEMKSGGQAWIVQTRPGVFSLRGEVIDKLNEEHAEREKNRPPEPTPEIATAPEIEPEGVVSDDPPAEISVKERQEPEQTVEADEPKRSRGRRQRSRRGRRRGSADTTSDEGRDEDHEGSKSKTAKLDAETDPTTESEDQSASADASDDKSSDEAQTSEPSSRGRRTRRQRRTKPNEDLAKSKEVTAKSKEVTAKSKEVTAKSKEVTTSEYEEADPLVFESQQRFESIAEAAYSVLRKLGSPHTVNQIATLVFQHKLVRFHTHDPEATVQASMVLENKIRNVAGTRPIFEKVENGWGLIEWHCSDRNRDRERQIKHLVDEIERETRTDLCKDLQQLSSHSIEPIMLAILNRLDYTNIKVSKRSADDGVYFSADWTTGVTHRRVCIRLVTNTSHTLSEEDVSGLRGALSHYSADEGMIVHVGPVAREVYRSQRQADQEHIELLDVDRIVDLLFRFQIGIRISKIPVAFVDRSFLREI